MDALSFTIEQAARWVADDELTDLSTNSNVTIDLTSDAGSGIRLVSVGGDIRILSSDDDAPDVAIHLSEPAWADLLSAHPAVRKQSVLSYLRQGAGGTIVGDEAAFAAHLPLVRRLIELLRPISSEPATVYSDLGDIAGHYVRVDVAELGDCDIYTESAGQGIPVLLLPTAGSDTRQFHELLADRVLTANHRLVSFDLPWHGKTSPPAGHRNGEYRLDSRRYADVIAGFITAAGLDRPILYGASMAGAAVVEFAAFHPSLTRGVIGAQVGPRVANRRTRWLRCPGVNQALHIPEWTYGLMAPTSPKAYRDRVWWSYSQGGYGVYDADIGYYTSSWDIDHVGHLFDGTVPVVLLSGVWDYSVPPSATLELSKMIPSSRFREMPELGHFPHAENPPAFKPHFRWALDQILNTPLTERADDGLHTAPKD